MLVGESRNCFPAIKMSQIGAKNTHTNRAESGEARENIKTIYAVGTVSECGRWTNLDRDGMKYLLEIRTMTSPLWTFHVHLLSRIFAPRPLHKHLAY